MKRRFWVLWTYIGNHSSLLEVEAVSPDEAIKLTTGCFDSSFQMKASIYVFDHPPVKVKKPSNT